MHGYPSGSGDLRARAERGLLQTVLRCALHAGAAAAVPAALALMLVTAGRAHAQAPAAEPTVVPGAAEQPHASVVLAAAGISAADSADKLATAARKAPSKRAVKPRAHARAKARATTPAAPPAKPTKFPAGWPVGPTPLPGAILPNN